MKIYNGRITNLEDVIKALSEIIVISKIESKGIGVYTRWEISGKISLRLSEFGTDEFRVKVEKALKDSGITFKNIEIFSVSK